MKKIKPWNELTLSTQLNYWKNLSPRVPPGWAPPGVINLGGHSTMVKAQTKYANPPLCVIELSSNNMHIPMTELLKLNLSHWEKQNISPIKVRFVQRGKILGVVDNPEVRIGRVQAWRHAENE